MIPQRSSVPLISSAPPTSSQQSFPIFLFFGIARNVPEIQTANLAFMHMNAQEDFGLAEGMRQEIWVTQIWTTGPRSRGFWMQLLDWALFWCIFLLFSLQHSFCNALPFPGCWIAVDHLTICSKCRKLVLCLLQTLFNLSHIWEYHRRQFIWS